MSTNNNNNNNSNAIFDVEYLTTVAATDRTGHFINGDAIVSHLKATRPSPIAVQLILEATELAIIDRTSGAPIERIPYNNMSHVQCHNAAAATGNEAAYARLGMFVVTDSFNIVPPEFYVFGFQHHPTNNQEFVNKLNVAISGKSSSNKPRPPVANKPNRNSVNMEEEARKTANLTQKFRQNQPSRLQVPWMNQPAAANIANGVVVVKPDDYLNILNHCFDDIESFIMRLQSAAEAFKELERRRVERKGDSGQGDGMLIFRSQPPPRDDFVNIFQKLKLTLNLLPKLKGQVKNPNAPEMAHYIFQPLEFITEASTTSVQGQKQTLAERVITPLLTPETLHFLEDCLVTKEMDLLKSLGPGWNISSSNIEYWSNFASDLSPYTPQFFDGWSPPESWLLEIAPRIDQTKQQASIMRSSVNNIPRPTSMIRASQQLVDNQSKRNSVLAKPVTKSLSNAETISQETFKQQIFDKGGTVYRAVYDWVAKKDTELDVNTGDYVEVLEVHMNWCRVRNITGLIGFLPTNVIKLMESSSGNHSAQPVSQNSQLDHDFEKVYSDPVNTKLNNLNNEFAQHVRLTDDKSRVLDLPKRAPKEQVATLTEKSTQAEVASWLQSKDFSLKVQQALGNLNGKEMFKKDKTSLEKAFGNEEGNRLFSQILVQRRVSGHATVRDLELNKILNKRKQKADDNLFADPNKPADESHLSNHF